MSTSSDIRLEDLLSVAINHVSELDEPEDAFLDEILPVIGGRVHSKDTAVAYKKVLVEQSIARINYRIRQKHAELSKFFGKISESWVGDVWTFDMFQDKHYLTKDELEFAKKVCHSNLIMDDVILLSNICSEVVKIRTAELLSREILEDKYGGDKGVNWILENEPISAKHRPKFLKKCGIIDSNLERNIQNIIETRNELIHDLDRRHQPSSPSELINYVDDCLEIIEDLDNHLRYPSMVRMYLDFSQEEYMRQMLGDVKQRVAEEDIGSVDEVYDIVSDSMISEGIVDEESLFRDPIIEVIQDDEKFIKSFHRLLNNSEAKSEDDLKNVVLQQANLFRKHFDINLLRKLNDNREKFEDRIPEELFDEDLLEEFDS